MNRYFIAALFLASCHSDPKTQSNPKIPPVSDTSKEPTVDNRARSISARFNNQLPFEIISFSNTINFNTTDTDTSKCSQWKLSKDEIERVIKNSAIISGSVWDLSFSVLTCTKTVEVIQKGQKFSIEINAASFYWVNNGDTSLLFGNFNKSDRKYFLEAPSDN